MPQQIRRLGWLCLAATCFALAILSPAVPATAGEIWFDALNEAPAATPDEMATAVANAAAQVQGRDPDELPSRWTEDRLPRIVFLSTSDGRTQARTNFSCGAGLAAALEEAITTIRAQVDPTTQRWFKLDVVEDVLAYPAVDLDFPLKEHRSLYGLAFDSDSGLAFLPEELVGNDLADLTGLVLQEQMADYLKRAGRDTTSLRKLYDPVDHPLFRFRTASAFWSEETGPVRLYRGHPLFQEATRDELVASATAGGRYLTRNVDDEGFITYYYDPSRDLTANDYNIVRHAGTLASMYELYKVTKDPELWAAAERARALLLSRVQPVRVGDQEARCIVYEGITQLGSNALTVIALCRRAEAIGRFDDRETAEQIGRWIELTQQPDGRFGVHKQVYPDGPADAFKSVYFPGEATLALARLHRATGDEHWLDSSVRGARWIIEVRDAEVSDADQEHDHWLLYALAELQARRPTPSFVAHTEKICRSILAIQHLSPSEPDWYGGYYRPPRSTPLATRNEGLMSAYRLLAANDRAELAAEVLAAMQRGTPFQLQSQYRPESALHFADPQRLLGGIMGGVYDPTVRNDFVQHNISALLGLAEILAAPPTTR